VVLELGDGFEQAAANNRQGRLKRAASRDVIVDLV
jgi:hypothetical protein